MQNVHIFLHFSPIFCNFAGENLELFYYLIRQGEREFSLLVYVYISQILFKTIWRLI